MSAPTRTRADAARNTERVLAAAAEVVADKGAEAGVPEIAARAGVGKATVYRVFPTKEHLVAAVIAVRMRAMAADARAAAERPDAWDAFVDLLVSSAVRMAEDCTFSAGLSHESALPEMTAAKQEMFEAMDTLMARAQAEGRMRAGVTSQDVRVLFAGASQMLRAEGNREPATWRRYAELVANAVRA